LAHTLIDTSEFRALPAKVAQWVVRQICGNWEIFWKTHTAYLLTYKAQLAVIKVIFQEEGYYLGFR
jgi:hypothetical protein